MAGLTAWVTLHPSLAYLAVFLLALSESIPVVGVMVPGTAVIVALSALVPGGAIQLLPLILVAFAGAVIGDGMPFWFGHRYHESILRRWPLKRYPQWIAKSESFIAVHGNKSVFLARFTPGLRAFVPLFAGILRMSAPRFYVANILSAAVWAPSHIVPGVLLGASFSHLGTASLPFAALTVIVIGFLWMVLKAVRAVIAHGTPLLLDTLDRLRSWALTRPSGIGPILARALDPGRAETRGLLTLGGLLIISAWLFLGIFEDVIGNDPLVTVDVAIYRDLQGLRTVPGDAVMIAITEIGDAFVVVSVALAVLGWLCLKRAWRSVAYWVAAVVGASLLNTVIKVALHRPRPFETLYSGWSAYSFPSGHSTVNVVLYGFLALLLVQGMPGRVRVPVIPGAVLLASLIAFSRLYLGAHWASDVLGGIAFGCAWIALLGVYYLYGTREEIGAAGLLWTALLALLLSAGTHVTLRHQEDLSRYAVEASVPSLTFDEWRSTQWQTLPARRIDLSGEIEEPFSLQWAGDIDQLRTALAGAGWVAAPAWNPAGLARWMSSEVGPESLPVVPALNEGRLPGLTMIQGDPGAPGPATRRILRLWPADVNIVGNRTVPLWLGSIIEERLYRPASLFTLVWTPDTGGLPASDLKPLFNQPDMVRRSDKAEIPAAGEVMLAGGV